MIKILYAIQGTGNGHLSRAREIIPLLQQHGELDILISGIQADVELPYPVKYKFRGLSFIFGKKGGIDLFATYRKSNLKKLYKEIKSLNVEQYNIVINDFEPVSAWACKLKNIPCIGLSHQSAVINPLSPKPVKKDYLGRSILQNYAPVSKTYGFHFLSYDQGISTPVIRQQIREAKPLNGKYFTVYLPAYSDQRIIKVLKNLKSVNWEVFSKHTKKEYKEGNIHIRPIDNDRFIESLINCGGILCGAGFETPAEALFLKKKLLVIPMKGQYEQQCNAAALLGLGVPVIKSLKKKYLETIKIWMENEQQIVVDFPDVTKNLLDEIIKDHFKNESVYLENNGFEGFSAKKLRSIFLSEKTYLKK